MKKIFSIVIAAAVFGSFFLFGRILAAPADYASYEITEFLRPIADFFGSFFQSSKGYDVNSLVLENEKLKAEILALKKSAQLIGSGQSKFLTVKVYSTYPFNHKDFLAINVGGKQGVKEGMAVTLGEHILIGQIAETEDHSSMVRTIFHPGWELPVKIGTDQTDALLVGGRKPKLTLITKERTIAEGDSVYSANKDFPYGLKIGEVVKIKRDDGSSFQEAELLLAYEIKDITEVLVPVEP